MIRTRCSKTFLPIICLFMGLVSCQPIYRPTVVDQPMMSGKGDVQLSGHAGTNGNELHLAGAPLEHLVVMGHYNTFSRDYEEDSLDEFTKEHQAIEIGAGYFRQLGEVGSNGNAGVVEVIGGYGHGSAKNYSDYWTSVNAEVNGDYHKFFFQPGIGYHHDVFDVGLTTRLSGLDYYDVKILSSSGTLEPTLDQGLDLFLEPALTARLGYKFVKLQMQLGLSFPIEDEPTYSYQPVMFSVGLHVDIAGENFGF